MKRSTVSGWLKAKDKIMNHYESSSRSSKRIKPCKYPLIDKALTNWFHEIRANNIPISGYTLLKKANDFVALYNIKGFDCTTSWIQRFKVRHNINWGESANVDKEVDKDQSKKFIFLFENRLIRSKSPFPFNVDLFGMSKYERMHF